MKGQGAFPYRISTDEEREVFRTFATAHPSEASEVNWEEFVKMAQEMNPQITEDALRAMMLVHFPDSEGLT